MLLCKSSLSFLIVFLFATPVFGFFSGADCLTANYSAVVSHSGYPMGLTKNILKIDKTKCVVTVETEKIRFLKRKWIVDVCRSPVHIKEGTGKIDVFKRDGVTCRDGEKSNDYCKSYFDLVNVVQDYGLIFADGEKETLTSDHGRVYCAYLLIHDYLKKGEVFTQSATNEDILGLKKASDSEKSIESGE